jgi:hypothetical protein
MRKAYAALRSDLGRRACNEGWGVTLFEYVAEHGVWPDAERREQLRDCAEHIEAAKADWPAVARDAHTRRAQRFERIANGLE